MSTEFRIKLLSALILPYLNYCCIVYNDVTKGLDVTLQWIVNGAIKFIFNIRRDEDITPCRLGLEWLSVSHRRKYFLAIDIYNIFHNAALPYLALP